MKKIILIHIFFVALFTSSCSLLGTSSYEYEEELELSQAKQEQAVSNFVVETFEGYGLYQNYTFTNSKKNLTIYHKQLRELYDVKYQMTKDGIMMGDSLRKVNKRIDTLKSFIEKKEFKTLYKIEHTFGFKEDSTLKLIRGDFYITPKNEVDSTDMNFVHTLPINLEKAYKHLIYRKAYKYHPDFELSHEEFDFYQNFLSELERRKQMGSTEEADFLDHTLGMLDIMIKAEKFEIEEITAQIMNKYLIEKNQYKSINVKKFSDVYRLLIEEKDSPRRNIYERTVNFSYIFNGKEVEEELLFQFNDFLEIIN